jgi:hypothetical protein
MRTDSKNQTVYHTQKRFCESIGFERKCNNNSRELRSIDLLQSTLQAARPGSHSNIRINIWLSALLQCFGNQDAACRIRGKLQILAGDVPALHSRLNPCVHSPARQVHRSIQHVAKPLRALPFPCSPTASALSEAARGSRSAHLPRGGTWYSGCLPG